MEEGQGFILGFLDVVDILGFPLGISDVLPVRVEGEE